MEGLARLVTESLARSGFETAPDHKRLRWSQWFPCSDSLTALFVPSRPGLLAFGEEIAAPDSVPGGRRMLAVFDVVESDDLGMALGRRMLSSIDRERLRSSTCFSRYSVIEDPIQRRSALRALQQWMLNSTQTATGIAMHQAGLG